MLSVVYCTVLLTYLGRKKNASGLRVACKGRKRFSQGEGPRKRRKIEVQLLVHSAPSRPQRCRNAQENTKKDFLSARRALFSRPSIVPQPAVWHCGLCTTSQRRAVCCGVLPADSLACQRELPAWGPGIGQSHEYSLMTHLATSEV
jgi:hypothetical protein